MDTDDGPIEQCNFLFSCETNADMTSDQTQLVELYTIACSITFFIIVIWILYRHLGNYISKMLYGIEIENEAAIRGVRYSEMNGIDAFIPVVERANLLDPVICANVSEVPADYLPIPKGYFDVMDDPQIFSVVKFEEFPFLDEDDEVGLRTLFSRVLYTEPKPPTIADTKLRPNQVAKPAVLPMGSSMMSMVTALLHSYS